MYPLMKEQLDSGGSTSFTIKGISMTPMLKNGVDSVRLIKPVFPLKKYQLPLYRRKDGSFILHRIVKVTENGYVCRGDHQFIDEKYVTDDMVVAVTEAYTHNGKWISFDSFSQKAYAFFRVNTKWARQLYAKCLSLAKAVYRRLFRRSKKK